MIFELSTVWFCCCFAWFFYHSLCISAVVWMCFFPIKIHVIGGWSQNYRHFSGWNSELGPGGRWLDLENTILKKINNPLQRMGSVLCDWISCVESRPLQNKTILINNPYYMSVSFLLAMMHMTLDYRGFLTKCQSCAIWTFHTAELQASDISSFPTAVTRYLTKESLLWLTVWGNASIMVENLWQQKRVAVVTLNLHSGKGREQEVMPGYKISKPVSSDPLSPGRFCLLEVLQPSQTASSTRKHVFKHGSLWDKFHIQTRLLVFKEAHNHNHFVIAIENKLRLFF